jgi:hypothetical protein
MKIRKFTLPLALILSAAMSLELAFASSETPLVPVANPAPLPSYMKGVNLSGYEYNPGPDGNEGVPCGKGGCDLPLILWTPDQAAWRSACSGVIYPRAECSR